MAETVTITTFLELKDNMSAGLGKVEAALKKIGGAQAAQSKVDRAQAKAQKEKTKEAEKAAKAQAKAQKEQERAAAKAAKEAERAARIKETAERRAQAAAQRSARAAQVAQDRDAARLAKMQQRSTRFEEQATKRRQREFDANAKKAQAASDRAWRDIQKKEAAKQAEARKTKDFIARSLQQNEEKHRKAAAQQARIERGLAKAREREQRQIERTRLGPRYDPAARAQQQLRDIRRVEAAQTRAAKQQERQQRAVAKQQEQAKKEQAEFIGKAGAAMFGAKTGGFLAAAYADPMAGLKLGVIGIIDGIVSGITTALSKAYDLTKAFFDKVYSVSKEYQMSIRRVAGSLVTMDFTPTFELATHESEKLYATMRDLAAKLPGETKDYMEVFSLALPQALHAGEQNLAKFTENVSKFTAFAMFRNVKDINQVARDMERMIMGKAIGRTRMFNEYLAYLQMATNNLKFGVKEFNKMSMPKRLELMYEVIEKSSETFKYMVNDADTLEGTFNTLVDQIMLVGGKPLFEAALSTLKLMNRMLTDNNSKLTEAVKLISINLGDALRGAVGWLTGYSTSLDTINSKTLEITGATGMLLDAVLDVVRAFGKVTEAARKAGESQRMEEREADLQRQREEKAQRAFRPDVQEAERKMPFGFYPGGTIAPIPEKPADVMTPAVPPSRVARALLAFGSSDPRDIERAADKFPRFAEALRGIPEKVERRYTPDIKPQPVPTLLRIPGEEKAVQTTWYKHAVGMFKEMDKGTVTEMLKERGVPEDVISKAYREAVGPRHMEGMGEEGEVAKGHKARGAPKHRASTINDFRFSKFDIRQEFAEGFDPDRIAVAFASDLAKLGEMRMQSAYAPLYSVMGG